MVGARIELVQLRLSLNLIVRSNAGDAMSAVSSSISHELPQITPRAGQIVCHCLRINRGEINAAIDAGEVQSVKCVIRETSAGSGCTACHCTIRRMIAARLPNDDCMLTTEPTRIAACLRD